MFTTRSFSYEEVKEYSQRNRQTRLGGSAIGRVSMLNPRRDLRMFLTFYAGLDKVKVIVPRHPAELELCLMGVVEGKNQLLNLLETVDVDHFIICSGDLPFRASITAYKRPAKSIVEDLEKVFEMSDEIPLKILRGEQLTEDEKSFRRLTSLHVASSSVEGVAGIERVHEWFKSKAA